MDASNHIATAAVLVVSDLRASVEWYVEHLEFRAAEVNWSENPSFCIVERDGAIMMLHRGERSGSVNRNLTPGLALSDAYIWVKDLKKLDLMLKMTGTPIHTGPAQRSYGCVEISVADPDDYLICFAQCV